MSKKILAIGGSMFAGRVFSIQMSKKDDVELHVVNRGQFPLNLENVKEFKSDRHSPPLIDRLLPKDIEYDACVDFCAYEPGDITSLLNVLKSRIKQYIVFSTASVYERYDHTVKHEGDPVIMTTDGDRVSDYIYKKVQLEHETIAVCKAAGIPYTILRPTFIYGPFNYAPRETYFVELIARGHVVPVPTDATAKFNMVYVFDVARAVELCIGDSRAHNEIFNLAAPLEITYPIMLEAFEQFNGGPFMTRPVTVDEVFEQNIPLPFPLTEDELFSGQKFADTFEFEYTSFMEGMEKTYKLLYSLFTA